MFKAKVLLVIYGKWVSSTGPNQYDPCSASQKHFLSFTVQTLYGKQQYWHTFIWRPWPLQTSLTWSAWLFIDQMSFILVFAWIFHIADELAAKMTTTVQLRYLFLAFYPISEGIRLNCPFSFLNQNAHLGSGKPCATMQLQTKLPCPSVNLSVSENERLNPAKWHLESLSLKVRS